MSVSSSLFLVLLTTIQARNLALNLSLSSDNHTLSFRFSENSKLEQLELLFDLENRSDDSHLSISANVSNGTDRIAINSSIRGIRQGEAHESRANCEARLRDISEAKMSFLMRNPLLASLIIAPTLSRIGPDEYRLKLSAPLETNCSIVTPFDLERLLESSLRLFTSD
jgi:hypothetical protein